MSRADSCEVAVIGGGPVGLLLAILLGRRGIPVDLFEARAKPAERSMAIGITPPSQTILEAAGVAYGLDRAGVRIRRAVVYENRSPVGALSFGRIRDARPWILSVPQACTEQVLRDAAASCDGVRLHAGTRVQQVRADGDSVWLDVQGEDGRERNVRASFVAGCDGSKSMTRRLMDVGETVHHYRPVFAMADAPDETDLGDDACLFFGPERPVESFPLPGRSRRWIVRNGWGGLPDTSETLSALVERLAGCRVPGEAFRHPSEFRPYRLLARSYYRGRMILCGDAAHVMSPIGGQGMNTGFGDAAMLAETLHAILHCGADPSASLRAYESKRKRAFVIAARRAATGMTLGVLAGRRASAFRGALIRNMLGAPRPHDYIARWFAMKSLPGMDRSRAA